MRGNADSSGTLFKHGVPEAGHAPADANDFDDAGARRRHALPVGKAVVFDDLYRSRVMHVGDVSTSEEGEPIYHLYADPETLRKNGVADYFLDAALAMTSDVLRTPPEKCAYGFSVAPASMDKPEETARAEYAHVESAYREFEEWHGERAKEQQREKDCRTACYRLY